MGDQKFFFDQNFFSTKFFFEKNFSTKKRFSTKKFFSTNFRPKIVFRTKKNFSTKKIFSTKNSHGNLETVFFSIFFEIPMGILRMFFFQYFADLASTHIYDEIIPICLSGFS